MNLRTMVMSAGKVKQAAGGSQQPQGARPAQPVGYLQMPPPTESV